MLGLIHFDDLDDDRRSFKGRVRTNEHDDTTALTQLKKKKRKKKTKTIGFWSVFSFERLDTIIIG
jgi:hypothetical protein